MRRRGSASLSLRTDSVDQSCLTRSFLLSKIHRKHSQVHSSTGQLEGQAVRQPSNELTLFHTHCPGPGSPCAWRGQQTPAILVVVECTSGTLQSARNFLAQDVHRVVYCV